MSIGKRRFSGWPVVAALLAGVGVGLWGGISVRESHQAAPADPGERVVRPFAPQAPHHEGQAGIPTVPPRPAGLPALDGCAETPTPDCLARLEQQMAEGAYAVALPVAERLIISPDYRRRVAPLLVRATAGLAAAALEAGRPSEALQWLERGLAAVGEEGSLLLLSARAYHALGDPANARYYFERAVRFEPALERVAAPELRRVLLEQAVQLRAGGHTDAALALLTEAAQRYPADAEYQRALAELRLERGEVDAAAAAAGRAVALGGDRHLALAFRVQEAQRARDERGVTRVPLEARDGVLYVAVRINDQPTPLRFVLDTGASHTAIAAHVAVALGLGALPGAAPVSVSTASGPALARLTRLQSVAVADQRVENVPALVLDGLHGADGLLGLSFLQRFHTDIRPEEGYVELHRR